MGTVMKTYQGRIFDRWKSEETLLQHKIFLHQNSIQKGELNNLLFDFFALQQKCWKIYLIFNRWKIWEQAVPLLKNNTSLHQSFGIQIVVLLQQVWCLSTVHRAVKKFTREASSTTGGSWVGLELFSNSTTTSSSSSSWQRSLWEYTAEEYRQKRQAHLLVVGQVFNKMLQDQFLLRMAIFLSFPLCQMWQKLHLLKRNRTNLNLVLCVLKKIPQVSILYWSGTCGWIRDVWKRFLRWERIFNAGDTSLDWTGGACFEEESSWREEGRNLFSGRLVHVWQTSACVWVRVPESHSATLTFWKPRFADA